MKPSYKIYVHKWIYYVQLEYLFRFFIKKKKKSFLYIWFSYLLLSYGNRLFETSYLTCIWYITSYPYKKRLLYKILNRTKQNSVRLSNSSRFYKTSRDNSYIFLVNWPTECICDKTKVCFVHVFFFFLLRVLFMFIKHKSIPFIYCS